jgi:hypothetical protein
MPIITSVCALFTNILSSHDTVELSLAISNGTLIGVDMEESQPCHPEVSSNSLCGIDEIKTESVVERSHILFFFSNKICARNTLLGSLI